MLTAIDMFAGWGGSTSGWDQVPGIQPVLAINHNPVAVEAHQLNFPHVDHDCADLSTVDPRRYPRTDIAWISPSCTAHSNAQGKKRDQPDLFYKPSKKDEEAERSRATMWNGLEFAEQHEYRYMVFENVVEIRTKWRMWPAWTRGLDCLDYLFRVIYFNSMFAGVAQSRNRVYVVAWRRGERAPDLDRWLRPIATCTHCGHTGQAVQAWKRPDRQFGVYGRNGQYWYRCEQPRCHQIVHPEVQSASTVLDLSRPAPTLGERDEPLESSTLSKIRTGIARHERTSDVSPEHLVFDYNGPARLLSEPLPTQTTVEGNALLGTAANLDEVRFRMLEDFEVQLGMGFPKDYKLLGTRRQRFAGLGAAVTPPVPRVIGAAIVEAAEGESRAVAS